MDIREIAKRAKVSTATVSRAINRVPTVDPQLAKRVWKVVEELGYYPNTQARALVSGGSNIRINYQHGIRQAVQHLAALRHIRIAFVMGPPQLKSALARRAAFE